MVNPSSDSSPGPSQGVADFYAECNVLLTGASGFLGKLLIEKILRASPKVNRMFLVVRAKKGKSSGERFKELFNDVVFDKLKEENPQFARKVVLIEGDMGEIGLGLSLEDRELLRTTHIVLHGAATVRFNEPIRIAANINVRGTRELVSVATEMPNLKAFVHVSTAYCYCVHELIEEKFYPPPMDPDKLLALMDTLDDAALGHLTPVLLGKWPNVYAFTKAISEDIIRRSSRDLPLCIVRPSIVVSTNKEPIPGWIDNIYGPTGVGYGAGIGLLRTLHCDKSKVADLIPADYVVNSIIVAAWDVNKTRSEDTNDEGETKVSEAEGFPIYNVVSSCQNSITWEQFMKYTEVAGLQIPSTVCLWYYCFTLNKHLWIHNLYEILLHFLPAVIFDTIAKCIGREPMLWKAYEKIRTFSSVISHFTTRQWQFRNDRVLRMWESLSAGDRIKYNFNVADIDWPGQCRDIISGMRVYIAKDPLDTLPAARAKYTKLKVAHYTLVTVLCGILVWLLWIFFRFMTPW